jgi:hypothetical protein
MKCDSCGKTFNLSEARLDEHWNDPWSTKPAGCYCPYCNHVLENVYPTTVDFARKLNKKNIIGALVFFSLWGVGLFSNTLNIIGPTTVLLFGGYLSKYSVRKDHRIIGWLLIATSIALLIWVN